MFKQKKLSLGARFGLSVASFFLGLLLLVSTISTALVADVQIIISEDGFSGIFRTMMSAPAHVHPKAPTAITGENGLRVAPRILRTYQTPHWEEPGNVASNLTDQLISMFYDQLGDQFSDVIPVSKEEFTQMINESTVKDFIADKTASLITDYFNDEITTTFEPEEIVQLINENAELIETITGEPIPEDIAQQVAQIFDENEIITKVETEGLAGFMDLINQNPGGSEDLEEGSGNTSAESGPDILHMIKEYYGIVSTIASTQTLTIGIAVCVVLIAGIILINCRQLGKGLRRAGYPLLIAGSAVVLNIMAKFNPDMWVVNATGNEWSEQAPAMILKLVRHILLETAVVNIIVFSTGFVLFVGGIVLSIVLRPKKASPVSIPATAETEELATAVVDETPEEILPEETPEEVPAEEAPAEEIAE